MSSDLDTALPALEAIRWDAEGLIPVIAQEAGSGRVLMFAYMNRAALEKSLACGQAVYWSRSRQRFWHKGEASGHFQNILSIRTDCDGDVLLLTIEQVGGMACHTGRASCFFHELQDKHWVAVDPMLQDPKEIYAK